jgi:hypothetical protein
MSLAQELERLAELHSKGALTAEEFAAAKTRLLSASRPSGFPVRSLRRQSSATFAGLPLWEIALGPDPDRGELRGHARAIFAVGDMATGWFAFGGLARGLIAVGGLAIGVVALGGGAIGGLALGGGAMGFIAAGGGAFGYYAFGAAAAGAHTLSAMHQDPEALDFLHRLSRFLRGGRA